MRLPLKQIKPKKVVGIGLILVLVAGATLVYPISKSYAAGSLTSTSIQLSDPRPYNAGPPVAGSGVTYTTTFTTSGTTSIQCMQIVFKDDPAMGGTEPAGMVTTSFAKGSISGGGLTDGDWGAYNTTDGTLQFEFGAGGTTSIATPVVITATAIRNPSIAANTPFYAQITTYGTLAGHVCSVPVDSSNIMGLVTTGGVNASVTVQNTLALNVANNGAHINGSVDASTAVVTTSNSIPFGTVAAGSSAWGSQKATVSTNAAHGYTLYLRDNPQLLTNATNDTIAGVTGTVGAPSDWDGAIGQSRFGYTFAGASAVTLASNKWAGLTTTNVAIATKATPISAEDTNVEYKVAISNVQPPGTYNSVVTYTLTPAY